MLTVVHALVFLGAVAAAPAPSDQLPVISEGKLASVALLDAGRASADDLKACCPGAADALKLVFLTRSTDAPTDFTMSPATQTLIDRQPYEFCGAGNTRPQLVVYDVDKIFQIRPDLAGRVPTGFTPHLAVVITIPGDTSLPETGHVDFEMKLGYHRQIEPFSFGFTLPKKQAPPTPAGGSSSP
jgi:hypothetical protein